MLLAPSLLAALALSIPVATFPAAAAPAADFTREAPAQDVALSLTLYQDGRSWVRQMAPMSIVRGDTLLVWPRVAATIEPETFTARILEGQARILSVTPPRAAPDRQALLRQWIGQEVELVETGDSLAEKVTRGTLVGAPGGSILLLVKDALWIDPPGSLRLPYDPAAPPPGPKPATILLSARQVGGRAVIEVSYRAEALSWSADYRAVRRGGQLDFEGWITLSNDTGLDFANAGVKLLAGDVARQPAAPKLGALARGLADMTVAEAAPPEPLSRESLGTTHLYTLAQPADLPSGARTRLMWVAAAGLPARLRHRLESPQGYSYGGDSGAPARHPDALVSVESKAFDQPLPAGVVRLLESDAGGALQEVGEDAIQHLPAGAPFDLRFGAAFDLLAERRQTEHKPEGGGRGAELACEIGIRNAGKTATTVEVRERFHGRWRIEDSSVPARRVDATTAEFLVPVPAGGEASLTYRASVRY
jgi:hypothetical protein